jgi:hypothetical protein
MVGMPRRKDGKKTRASTGFPGCFDSRLFELFRGPVFFLVFSDLLFFAPLRIGGSALSFLE